MPGARIIKYAWWALALLCLVSYLKRNDLRSVNNVDAPVLFEPRQEELYDPAPVSFTADGFAYELMPLYAYQINGIVVGKYDYRHFSLQKLDNIFPVDLCLIWGGNARRKVHRENTVSFSQDCRWCWVQWRGEVRVDLTELSNNHLLIKDRRILKLLSGIGRGDQIAVRGKLVNVRAHDLSHPERQLFWNTSTTRLDNGAGACEVILVEEIKVLREANVLFRWVFKLSFWLLVLLTGFIVIRRFMLPVSYDG